MGKKPIRLIKDLMKWQNDKNSLILDFFSGSASTAHAVMELNAEDDGNRKFIMVQFPENLDDTLEKLQEILKRYKRFNKNIR